MTRFRAAVGPPITVAIAVTRPLRSAGARRGDPPTLAGTGRSRALSLVFGKLPKARYYCLTSALFFGYEGHAERLPAGVSVRFETD